MMTMIIQDNDEVRNYVKAKLIYVIFIYWQETLVHKSKKIFIMETLLLPSNTSNSE